MFKRHVFPVVALLALLSVSVLGEERQLRLAEVFCDNMVLQQSMAVPVWGWAAPGQKIMVKFAGQEKSAAAGQDGKWMVSLDPMPAYAEPRSMDIAAEETVKSINGVLVGEVWLCSGQSNMVFCLGASKLPKGLPLDYPLIREFTVPRSISLEKEDSFKAPRAMAGHEFTPAKAWSICAPATAGKFSAVALLAAMEMFKELKIPIGIINCSFNGSSANLWIPVDVLRKEPLYGEELKTADKELESYNKSIDKYESDQKLFLSMKDEFERIDNKAVAAGAGTDELREEWTRQDVDAKGWDKLTWGWTYGTPTYIWDGPSEVWFRTPCVVTTPAEGDIKLLGGDFRNCQVRYFFNGAELKETGRTKDGQPEFTIMRSELVKNRGLLAIRARCDHKLACLWRVPSSKEMLIPFESQSMFRIAQQKADAPFRLAGHKYPPKGLGAYPGSRYNAMLNPLIPYAVKGFLWYQGESECMNGVGSARLYAHTLPLLVQTWRGLWGGGEKPFVAVQLAGCLLGPEPAPAELRESQKAVLALPGAALSPSMDIREPNNWHPGNKYDIGVRAGRAALACAYEKHIPFSGPMFKSLKVEGDKIRVSFDQVCGGLAVGEKEGLEPVRLLPVKAVPHFQVAGDDGKFVPAEAEIAGDAVLVWSDNVKEPTAVRYAWDNMPANPLLYNRAGLPACSFRSDDGVDVSSKSKQK